MSGAHLSQIETRQIGYSIETLDLIAKALQVKAGELLDRDPNDRTGIWAMAERLALLPSEQRDRLISAAEMLVGVGK